MDSNLATAIVTAAATGGSTVAVAIVAILHSNKRIDDMARTMDARFADFSRGIDVRFADVNRHIDDKFELLGQQMRGMEDNLCAF
jgi:hypothetical protein